MKKTILMTLAVSVAIVAGGNKGGDLSSVAPVTSSTKCHLNGTYLEQDTGLMWQDEHYTPQEDGAFKNNRSVGKVGNHRYAATYCRRLNYAGYSDWRLPTKEELMHVHRIPGQVFVNNRDNDFWSDTPAMGKKYYVVYPADAYPFERSPKQSNYIRCVRCAGVQPVEE